MKPHVVKDYILKSLINNNSDMTKMAKELKVDRHYVFYCAEMLVDEGYLTKHNTATVHGKDMIIILEPKGKSHYIQFGGFTKAYWRDVRSNIFLWVKIGLTSVSTLAIIVLTYLNYKATDKANDNKVEFQRLHKTIDSLKQIKKPLK